MSTSRTLMAGGALALAALVGVVLGDALGWDVDSTILLGVAVGGVLAIVAAGGVFWRLLGFGIGFVVAWASYPIRAGFLPDSSSGRAVAAVLVLLIVTGLIALTFGRTPLWSGLLGVAAMVGAYEAAFTASPPDVLSTSPTWATSILLSAALGFAAGVWFAPGDEEEDMEQGYALQSSSEAGE